MNVKRRNVFSLLGSLLILASGCSVERALEPIPPSEASFHGTPSGQACWGQASAVFARMGAMGQHSASYPTPRLGLRNLARLLYDAGIIDDDTMQALGAYVASALNLSIEACLVGED
jgi:hypothetical protein